MVLVKNFQHLNPHLKHFGSEFQDFKSEVILAKIYKWDQKALEIYEQSVKNPVIKRNRFLSQFEIVDDLSVSSTFGSALNNAVEKSSGKILIFLSGNVDIRSDFIKNMIQPLQNELIENTERIGMVGCKMLTPTWLIYHVGFDYKFHRVNYS